jgi:quinol monooxygenase YgiN
MVKLFVRHPVADYGSWREQYDAFDDERRDMGVTAAGVYQGVDDPNDITVWHDFESRDAAESFVASPRLREVMDKAGVAGEPSVWFTTKV